MLSYLQKNKSSVLRSFHIETPPQKKMEKLYQSNHPYISAHIIFHGNPSYPPPKATPRQEIAGLIKGLLTIARIPLNFVSTLVLSFLWQFKK